MIKRIVYNIVFVLFVVIVLDFTIGKTLNHLYFQQVAGTAYETNFAIDSTIADIIILGSSRASHHYLPSIFEDSLGMSCYNVGRNGNFLMYGYAMFTSITKRYTPKMVIFDISPGEMNYNKDHYDRLSSLLPYYQSHPEIREIIQLRSPYEKIKLYSSIYPYNSILFETVSGNFYLEGKREKIYQGYIPLAKQMSDTFLENVEDKKATIDTNTLNAIFVITKICKQRNIRLIIVSSPLYANFTVSYTNDLLESFSKKNQVEFMNFINDSVFNETPIYFHDPKHLNHNGAVKFSQLLVDRLKINYKKILNKQ